MGIRRALVAVWAVFLVGCDSNSGLSWFDGTIGGVGGGAPPTVTLEVPLTPGAEGTTLSATVRLSKTFTEAVTVPFTVTLVTAGVNDIVQMTTSPVTIAAGQTSATIDFTVVDDPFQEEPPTETFQVALGAPSVGQLGAGSQGTLSITDSDIDGLGNSVSGRVTDAATGTGLADVAVFASAGGASAGAVTDAQGFYKILGPPTGASVLVVFSKAGYTMQARSTEGLTSGRSAVVVNVPMTAYAYTEMFDPTMAHVTMVPGSTAQVSFAANSLETTTGAAPTGNVTVSLTPLSAGGDVNVMPGTYRAGDGVTAPVPVESFGALHLNLVDSGSNVLRLAAGQTAVIRIPAATRGASLPATLSLYYYDATLELWRQEGTAGLLGTAPDQYYEATVARLPSFWAAQRAYAPAAATGCVVDLTGSRVGGATVVAEGITYSGAAAAVTDAQGNFSVPTRSGSSAFVQATFRTGISNAVNVPPLGTSPPCLVVYAGAASIKLTWGEFPSDLDSHTYGPNQAEDPNHVHWSQKGSLTAAPFVALDVDDVTGFGPEVTTIVKAANNRKYRFMVRNFSQTYAPGQTGSPAKVELFIKGRQFVFTPPPGEMAGTTTWHVFDLQSDASCEVAVVIPAPVTPWLSLSEADMDDLARNPNTDDTSMYCN